MFKTLQEIVKKPEPFECYTADMLWTDPYISKKMLEYHLDESVDLASRNHELIDRSVDWIVKQFNVTNNTRICDFGCGPGLYANRLARHGAQVTGIDFSERSIEHARNEADTLGLEIDYIHTDYLEFKSDDKFDLITMIFCDFCALSPDHRGTLLSKFAALLADGGAIVMDVLSDRHFEDTSEQNSFNFVDGDGFWTDQPHFVFESMFKYNLEQLLLSKFTIVEADRTREIYNWLQCFSVDRFKEEVSQHGLDVLQVFANVAGDCFNESQSQFSVVIGAD